MRPADNINELIKKLKLKAGTDLDRRVHDDISMALAESDKIKSAITQPYIGRTIMKNPITKLAAAAVIIVAVLVGITQFGGSGTSVVWADVAQKVQASRGVIFRRTDTATDSQEDYSMNYMSGTHSRFDFYKGDQIIKTCHDNYGTKTSVYIFHDHKKYFKRTGVEGLEQEGLWVDPISMIQRFLSHGHRQLEPKTVEGVLCEGIETTDSAFLGADFQADSFMARVWVSVDTGYPVKFEGEIVKNSDQIQLAFVADQFQWDVELVLGIFEPNIPPDYEGVTWPGIVEP